MLHVKPYYSKFYTLHMICNHLTKFKKMYISFKFSIIMSSKISFSFGNCFCQLCCALENQRFILITYKKLNIYVLHTYIHA